MAAPESTKYQINYKLSDGTLINLYAKDVRDLESGLADLGMVSTLIKSTGADLGVGSAPASATSSAVSAITNAFPGATQVAPPQDSAGGQACKHGAMTYREGTNARGLWRGYMCPSPKGALDKCDTIFIR